MSPSSTPTRKNLRRLIPFFALAGLAAPGCRSTPPPDDRDPAAARARLPEESMSERGCRLFSAAEASHFVYRNFGVLKKSPQLFRPEEDYPTILYPDDSAAHLAPTGYKLSFVINGAQMRKGHLFVAFYEAPGKPPIAAFKGTNSAKDFWADLTDQGAGYLADIVGSMESVFRDGPDGRRSSPFEKFLSRNFLRGPRVIFTGHSLGGALAQSLAYYVAQKRPDLGVEVVTFNPLGGSSTYRKLNALMKGGFEEFDRPLPNLRALSFATADDLVVGLNRIGKHVSLGPVYTLASGLTFSKQGNFYSRGWFAGHDMRGSATGDLLWTQRNFDRLKADMGRALSRFNESELKRLRALSAEKLNAPKTSPAPSRRAGEAQLALRTYDKWLEIKRTVDEGPGLVGLCPSVTWEVPPK